ncbi:OLC1v1021985C1 [Oldenlandia corymbosa var. corymbosa]|uniref:OLC1v1021985C1 n=1 Tax=Oldenlandia corymbosa var. corymbosa TaxID=529605 RepID=A0AAV1BZ53_OLDCO|nr:OLC1v1021985C1 [Oldenlandia corymbosa var. corymbosa]
MALRLKLRSISVSQIQRSLSTSSSILNPDSKTPLTSKEKSRAAISLLRSEKNPERILEICRAASLTPESHMDRVAYSSAISKLKDLNYFSGIRGLIEESITRPDIKSERSASHFIILYGKAGLLGDAVKTFEKMHGIGLERTVKTLNSLILSCIVAKDYKEMKRVYLEFPNIYGIVPDLETYNRVIKGLCESGDSKASFSILNEMEKKNVKPNAVTFRPMIAGFYEEQDFEGVGKVLEKMEEHNITLGVSTYNIRIQSLCKLKRSKEAKALFEGMVSRGMKPNVITYGNLILGFCKEDNLEEAKSLFERMVKNGVDPDSQCYFTLIYFLCQGKDFEAALKIFKDCIAKNWVPNFSTMKSLVEGLARISMVDEAKEVIGELKEKFPTNSDRWTEIEDGLAK